MRFHAAGNLQTPDSFEEGLLNSKTADNIKVKIELYFPSLLFVTKF
jgi:hypothetical protein